MQSKHCNCDNTERPLPTIENQQGKTKSKKRFVNWLKMTVPAFIFIIIPKCPVCLAGYIALISGVSLSITTAGYVRIGLMMICVLSLTWFIIRQVSRYVMNK